MKTSAQSESEDQTQWENVGCCRVWTAIEDFFCDPTAGAVCFFNDVTTTALRLYAGQMGSTFRQSATQSEIGQFHHRMILFVGDEENVVRFQVAVDDLWIISVQAVKSLSDLAQYDRIIRVDGRTVVAFLDEVIQRSNAQLSDDITIYNMIIY